MIVLGIVALIVLILAFRALFVLQSVKTYKAYWETRAVVPVKDGDFCYVALGDSAAQGIGATSPMRGYVGIIANRAGQLTGKPVHITNISKTGAKLKDALQEQVPKLKNLPCKPDLVTIDIGCNDMRGFELTRFEQEFEALAKELPKDTVMLEISPYFKDNAAEANKVMHRLATKYGIIVAPFNLQTTKFTWRDYGGDFFHPSNAGHQKWANGFLKAVEPLLTTEQ